MKSEKGFVGIDIAIAIIVLFIFVSIIANLFYKFNSSSKEVELKAKATEIAINEIEEMKQKNFAEIEDIGLSEENTEYISLEEVPGVENQGFYRLVKIEDYALLNPDKIQKLVKKITVQIQYKFKKDMQKVELSTIISKES